jgi:hypothetical protein
LAASRWRQEKRSPRISRSPTSTVVQGTRVATRGAPIFLSLCKSNLMQHEAIPDSLGNDQL